MRGCDELITENFHASSGKIYVEISDYNFYNLNKQINRIKLGFEASKGFWTLGNPSV